MSDRYNNLLCIYCKDKQIFPCLEDSILYSSIFSSFKFRQYDRKEKNENFRQKMICQVTPSNFLVGNLWSQNHLSVAGTDEFNVSFLTTKILINN